MTAAPSYCIDTSSFVTAWNETYRPGNFPSFWKRVEELIDSGRAVACEEVQRELSGKDDVASAWANEQPKLFVPLEEEQIAVAKQLAKEFPALAKERLGRSRADGFVIALAMVRGLTVVTAENGRGAEKIPNICDAKKVSCVTLADLIETEGWGF